MTNEKKHVFIEEEKVPQQMFSQSPVIVDKSAINAMLPQNEMGGNSDKYYKKFDFFYKRTCFRLMAEFYKLTFQPF
jgi:hypothetical protein